MKGFPFRTLPVRCRGKIVESSSRRNANDTSSVRCDSFFFFIRKSFFSQLSSSMERGSSSKTIVETWKRKTLRMPGRTSSWTTYSLRAHCSGPTRSLQRGGDTCCRLSLLSRRKAKRDENRSEEEREAKTVRETILSYNRGAKKKKKSISRTTEILVSRRAAPSEFNTRRSCFGYFRGIFLRRGTFFVNRN